MKVLVAIATYNEVENVALLAEEIHRYLPSAHILFLDDNSPDGTGALLDKLASSNPKLFTMHRKGKLGLGSAHLAMMDFFLQHPLDFDYLITMDSDFSHHPRYLPEMLRLLEDGQNGIKPDFVIGSRYVTGGGSGYGIGRHLLSITANTLTKILLRIPLQECTTAYRGYTRALLSQFRLIPIKSNGYSFFVESLYRIHKISGCKMAEFPILFEDRVKGKSKINKKEVFWGVVTLLRLFSQRILA